MSSGEALGPSTSFPGSPGTRYTKEARKSADKNMTSAVIPNLLTKYANMSLLHVDCRKTPQYQERRASLFKSCRGIHRTLREWKWQSICDPDYSSRWPAL